MDMVIAVRAELHRFPADTRKSTRNSRSHRVVAHHDPVRDYRIVADRDVVRHEVNYVKN